MTYDPDRSALDPSASAEVDYPWERDPQAGLPGRFTVTFAGEPLSVTKSQLDAIRRLGDPHEHHWVVTGYRWELRRYNCACGMERYGGPTAGQGLPPLDL